MMCSSGSGTVTVAPVASTPLRTVRRSMDLIAMVCTVRLGLWGDDRERVVRHDGEDQIPQLETRRLEGGRQRVQHGPVHGPLFVTDGVRVVFAHEALSDRDALARGDPKPVGVVDGNAIEAARRIDRQTVVGGAVSS